ncbi:MAG: fumarylacetoacetate hydrolase family protein [Halioglobus sp.]|nr:fumarylacetoacetate hydrolase family protein [Halioglobus sp.]
MLTDEIHKEIAAKIYHCINEITPMSLLTTAYPDIEIGDSYRIQNYVVASFKEAGSRVKGYKIGLTSKAVQQLVGSTEPNLSPLLDHMFAAEESELARSNWLTPVVESEMAFIIKDRLTGPGVNVADVIRATDFVLPAIEIADFRVARAPGMDARDITADMGAAGGVVLGVNAFSLNDIDILSVKSSLIINEEERAKGMASEVLGNPIVAVAWLANKLSESGTALEPGDVILSGAMHNAQPVEAGDQIIARFDNGLGEIKLSFS